MKKRTLNEYRQTKDYKLSDQGGEYTVPHKGAEPQPFDPSKYDGDVERDYIEEAKIEIADKVVKHLDDVIFEMVCEEMGNRDVFQSQNYLTDEGYELFDEQWFEFYHEHHGDILAQIRNKLTY